MRQRYDAPACPASSRLPIVSPDLRLRPITDADLPVLLELNNAAVPNVDEISAEHLANLVSMAAVPVLAESDGIVRGFALALPTGVDYVSRNYRWFGLHYPDRDFHYLDRIVVGADGRGSGVGAALYREVIEATRRAGVHMITCEVNTVPPNPGSMRFHQRLGFTRVGTLIHDRGDYQVALLTLSVPDV